MEHGGEVIGLSLAGVGVALLLVALISGRLRRQHAAAAASLLPLAATAAGLLAYWPLLGKSPTSDLRHDVVQRLWWGAATMAVVLAVVRSSTGYLRPAVRGIVAAVSVMLLPAIVLAVAFLPYRPADAPAIEFLAHQMWIPLLAIVGARALLEPIARRSTGAAAPLVVCLLATGIGGMILMSDSTAPGMSVAAVGASAAGVLLAAWTAHLLGRRTSLEVSSEGGVVLIWLMLLVGLMTFCCLDGDTVPTKNLLVLAAAPVLAWLPEIPPVHRWKPWRRELLRAALVAAPVILVLVRAYIAFRRENADIDLS